MPMTLVWHERLFAPQDDSDMRRRNRPSTGQNH